MTADPAPTTPAPTLAGPPRTMAALGEALGAAAWWCDQLFATAGGWVPDTDVAAVRIHLAELSRVAGEHAVALRRPLPRPRGADPEAWVAPPSAAATAACARLAGSSGAVDRLAGLHRGIVPRLLVTWRTLASDPAPVSPAAARAAGHAHQDLLALWHEGEGLLDALLASDPGAAAGVASVAAGVERALVGARQPPGTPAA